MTDNNKHENKTEELIKKQEARQLTEEELEKVSGGVEIFPIKAENEFDDYCGRKSPLDYGELHVLG